MAAQGEALRWGDEERRLMYTYLNDGRLNPQRIGSAAYLRSLKVCEAVWDRHANKNFYQNVRRMVAAWQAGQARAGGRRQGGNDQDPSPAAAAAAGDGGEDRGGADDSDSGSSAGGGQPETPAQRPQVRQQARRDRALAASMAGLRIGPNPPVPNNNDDDEEDMLIYHQYSWYEAILPAAERAGENLRLHRLSIDVLLPGPTSLNQIRAIVSDEGSQLHFTYRPPQTYLSHDRTAVRLAASTFGPNSIPHVRDTLAAATRAQAHRTALETIRPEQQEKVRHINLLFPCDRNFCRRDDWGRANRTEGMEIGMYHHEDPEMQRNNQFVWILHIELSSTERPQQDPLSPAGYGAYAAHA